MTSSISSTRLEITTPRKKRAGEEKSLTLGHTVSWKIPPKVKPWGMEMGSLVAVQAGVISAHQPTRQPRGENVKQVHQVQRLEEARCLQVTGNWGSCGHQCDPKLQIWEGITREQWPEARRPQSLHCLDSEEESIPANDSPWKWRFEKSSIQKDSGKAWVLWTEV